MAASLTFFAENDSTISNLSGSGLGFYGSDFGRPVAVGAYQGTTFITDSTGQNEGPICHNVKWAHPNSGTIEGTVTRNLLNIPYNRATLQIRFQNDSSVIVQNAEARIYDRSDIETGAAGVVTKVAEIIHPSVDQGVTGSGDTAWLTPNGSVTKIILSDSPGPTGHYAGSGAGSVYSNNTHDWYLAMSSSPSSIGSKTQYGLYVSLDYL